MRDRLKPLRLFMTADAVGGVFQYALDLADGLRAQGIETTLALLGPSMNASQRAAASAVNGLSVIETGLPLDWLAEAPDTVRAAAFTVAKLAAANDAQVVQLNTPALADAPYHAPVVAVSHSCLASWWSSVKGGELPGDFRWRTRLAARGLAAADAVVCPSRAFAEVTSSLYGCSAIAVLNGRTKASGPAKRELAPVALTAGRLWDEGKNIATLDAAARLTAMPILAAGPLEGPNGSRVTIRALRALGALGEAETRALFARRPIFVSPALYEPFGLAVLEAAQAGCALVLSDIPTFRELWEGAAIFVSARAPHAFAEALADLAADGAARERLGAAAQARSRTYSVEATAARMAAIHRALQARGAGARGAAA